MQYVGFRLKPGSSKISHNSKFYNSKAVLHAHQKVPSIYKWTLILPLNNLYCSYQFFKQPINGDLDADDADWSL